MDYDIRLGRIRLLSSHPGLLAPIIPCTPASTMSLCVCVLTVVLRTNKWHHCIVMLTQRVVMAVVPECTRENRRFLSVERPIGHTITSLLSTIASLFSALARIEIRNTADGPPPLARVSVCGAHVSRSGGVSPCWNSCPILTSGPSAEYTTMGTCSTWHCQPQQHTGYSTSHECPPSPHFFQLWSAVSSPSLRCVMAYQCPQF